MTPSTRDPASVSAKPTHTPAPVVLVHGAWHSAQHWRPVEESLADLGRHAICIDLPGHGMKSRQGAGYRGSSAEFCRGVSTVASVTVAEAATDVLSILQELAGRKPIVVAHSLAGPIISRAAEIAPELIGHLVYVSAHVPVRLKSPAAYSQLPGWQTGYGENLFVGDPAASGVVRINPRGNTEYLEHLRQAYYHDVSFEDFLPFARALTPDLPLGFWLEESELTAARWGRIVRTYVRLTLDRALAPAIQTMMIREADALTPDNRFQVIDLESSHSPFASQPKAVAAILAGIAGD